MLTAQEAIDLKKRLSEYQILSSFFDSILKDFTEIPKEMKCYECGEDMSIARCSEEIEGVWINYECWECHKSDCDFKVCNIEQMNNMIRQWKNAVKDPQPYGHGIGYKPSSGPILPADAVFVGMKK